MDYPLTFARNFSRLVWLLLNEGSAFEAQIATLRSLVNTSREGKVILGTHDLNLHVNGVPVSEHFTGGEDLTAQLIGHSVKEIAADQDSSPADLLVLARLLASAPVPGDGGANVCARLTAVDLRTVRVSVDSSGFPQASQESLAEWDDSANQEALVSPAAAGPFVADLAAEQGEERAPATVEKPFSTILKLFEQLDAASSASGVSRHLDGLVQLANDSARKDDLEAVADILHGIVAREAAVSDRGLRRVYGMAIRRLSAPGVLKCVTSLLPKLRENYDRYMSIIVRTEDAGAEALVDALSSASSIPERRLYFDSFLKLSTGVRTLVYMLGDDRWYVVRNAANLLGDMRAPEADAPLTRLLDHEDDRVRTAAVAALARLGTVSGVKGLRAALKDASAEVRERAAEALGMAKGRRSAATLIKALDAESDTHVQAAIIAALGQIGSADAVDKLVEMANGASGTLKQPDIALRVAAVHALGNTETPAASTALQSLLKDKHKDVRGAASWFTLAKSASI